MGIDRAAIVVFVAEVKMDFGQDAAVAFVVAGMVFGLKQVATLDAEMVVHQQRFAADQLQ